MKLNIDNKEHHVKYFQSYGPPQRLCLTVHLLGPGANKHKMGPQQMHCKVILTKSPNLLIKKKSKGQFLGYLQE